MIAGTGVDIVSIIRIRSAVERHGDAFLNRVYHEREVEYCRKRKDPYPCLAARFAAKEAVIKAMPTRETISFPDIEVSFNDLGKPVIIAGETLARALVASGSPSIHISISHEREYAVASVVVEKQ